MVKGTLRILAVDNVGETFNTSVCRLRYTPRKLLVHPGYKTLIVAEADHAAIPLAEREDLSGGLPEGQAPTVSFTVLNLCGRLSKDWKQQS